MLNLKKWWYLRNKEKGLKFPITSKEVQKVIAILFHTPQTRKRINEQLTEIINPLCPVLMKRVMDGIVEPEKEREVV